MNAYNNIILGRKLFMMNSPERIYVILDQKDAKEWKKWLNQFIRGNYRLGIRKLNNYLEMNMITEQEHNHYQLEFLRTRDELLCRPVKFQTDFISLMDLSQEYLNRIVDFSPKKKEPIIMNVSPCKN